MKNSSNLLLVNLCLAKSSLESARRFHDFERLENELAQLMQKTKQAWPSLHLTAEEFLPFVVSCANLNPQISWDSFLERGSDLYLVKALVQKQPEAFLAFEKTFGKIFSSVFFRLRLPQNQHEDMRQVIVQRLLVGHKQIAAKISKYVGKSVLQAWLRVTITRLTINELNSNKNAVHTDNELLENLVSPGADPALRHMQKIYKQEFREAFVKALHSLSLRERNFLRQRLLDGMRFDELEKFYQVHQATLFRWMNKIHQKLLKSIETCFLDHLQLTTEEFASIIRLIRSQLEISLSQEL